MIKGLAGATIWSEDLGNLLPFYRDVLGLPVGIQAPGFVVFGNLDGPSRWVLTARYAGATPIPRVTWWAS